MVKSITDEGKMQETLFGVEVETKTEEEIKEEKKAKELELTNLEINVKSDYIAVLEFEMCDEPTINIFKTYFSGRKVFNKKTKSEKFFLDRAFFHKGLEQELQPILDDIEFKSEEQLKEFLESEIKFNAFLREQNKKHLYWDTRRYFWKREQNNWKMVIPSLPSVPISHLEQKIKEKSDELKSLLKEKFGYPVILRVLKDEKGGVQNG